MMKIYTLSKIIHTPGEDGEQRGGGSRGSLLHSLQPGLEGPKDIVTTTLRFRA